NEFHATLAITPNDVRAHFGLGVAYRRLGYFDDAIHAYKAALRIRPDDARTRFGMGVAYRKQGLLKDAVREYLAALRVNPQYAEAHNNLAIAYKELHRLDDAIREAENAVELGYEPAQALLNTLRRLPRPVLNEDFSMLDWQSEAQEPQVAGGDSREAEVPQEKNAIDLEAMTTAKLREIAAQRDIAGRSRMRKQELMQAIRTSQAPPVDDAATHPVVVEPAAVPTDQKHEQRAPTIDEEPERELSRASASEQAQQHIEFGLRHLGMGSPDQAVDELRVALSIDPENFQAHAALANAFYEIDRLGDAVTEYKKALRLNPSNPEAHLNLGMVYEDQGLLAQAIAEYKTATRLATRMAQAHVNLGLAYRQQGDLPSAERELRIAAGLGSHGAEAFLSQLKEG
ncbi:MAG: tetratricopeptide repeat protein, partial [Anaerolineae bacterium]|nr:tetratricopeptide repeat protein [Anaerolineae bacterium]